MKLSCVLIVDDSEGDQYICADLIETEHPGTEILQAYDGQEALEILEKIDKKPDLIILDINMPRMNGHEFLEIYDQKLGHEKSSVVVMLTSSSQAEDRDKSMAHQCVVDYFIKPLIVEALKKLKEM